MRTEKVIAILLLSTTLTACAPVKLIENIFEFLLHGASKEARVVKEAQHVNKEEHFASNSLRAARVMHDDEGNELDSDASHTRIDIEIAVLKARLQRMENIKRQHCGKGQSSFPDVNDPSLSYEVVCK